MARAILMIEGEQRDIVGLRRLINAPGGPDTRNMIWHEDRVLRHNGGVTFAELSRVLESVMQSARAEQTTTAQCVLCGRTTECDIDEVSGQAYCTDSRERDCR